MISLKPNNEQKRPLSLSISLIQTIRLLVILAVIAPSTAFSSVGNPNEFCSGTSSTRTYVLPRYSLGSEPTETRVSISSRLFYRNGNEDDYATTKLKNDPSSVTSTTTRWAKPLIHPLSEDEDTSKKVDEYLEFLDKRYNRMHNREGPQSKKNPFSVLKWLGHEDNAESEEEDNHSNALYALGVAGLASERLLQKHGVTLRKCSIIQSTAPEDSIVVEHTTPDTPVLKMPSLLNKIFAAFSAKYFALKRKVALRRSVILRALVLKSKEFLKTAPTAIPRATTKFAKALVKAGGGERNIKVAATVTCAFAIYVAQPLVKSAIATRT